MRRRRYLDAKKKAEAGRRKPLRDVPDQFDGLRARLALIRRWSEGRIPENGHAPGRGGLWRRVHPDAM
jgi:hypothetical protein